MYMTHPFHFHLKLNTNKHSIFRAIKETVPAIRYCTGEGSRGGWEGVGGPTLAGRRVYSVRGGWHSNQNLQGSSVARLTEMKSKEADQRKARNVNTTPNRKILNCNFSFYGTEILVEVSSMIKFSLGVGIGFTMCASTPHFIVGLPPNDQQRDCYGIISTLL